MSPSNQSIPSIAWKTFHFLLFSLACRICMITQKDSLKEIKLKELESECY